MLSHEDALRRAEMNRRISLRSRRHIALNSNLELVYILKYIVPVTDSIIHRDVSPRHVYIHLTRGMERLRAECIIFIWHYYLRLGASLPSASC